MILHAGDVVYPEGARHEYTRRFFREFGPLLQSTPIVAAIGNHDAKSEDGRAFADVFEPREADVERPRHCRSIEIGPVHVAILDTRIESLDTAEAQARWLQADLAQATRPWRIVLTHVPIVLHSEQRANWRPDQLEAIDALVAAAESGGVSVIFAGHSHWYERHPSTSSGLVQVVTGGGGATLKDLPSKNPLAAVRAFHFVRARFDVDQAVIQAIDKNGAAIDASFTIARRTR